MSDEKPMTPENENRRDFLKGAAVATGAVAAGALAASRPALGAEAGSLAPLAASITSLGLSSKEVAMLTSGAKKLSKRDLVELRQWWVSREGRPPLSLSIEDVDSIEKAFDSYVARISSGKGSAEGAASCCCCCSPCCCCAAAVDPPKE
jgi:hypothetical protein